MKTTRLSTFEWLLLGIFATLLVASRVAFHLPLKVPGKSGIPWMALLLTASAVVPRSGAATATGALAGVMAIFVGLGDRGALVTLLSYLAAGAAIDLTRFATARRETMAIFAFAGLAGNTAKLGVKATLDLLAGIPAGFVVVGRAYSAVSYTIFGLAGGALGFLIVRTLRRAGYFAYLQGRR